MLNVSALRYSANVNTIIYLLPDTLQHVPINGLHHSTNAILQFSHILGEWWFVGIVFNVSQ